MPYALRLKLYAFKDILISGNEWFVAVASLICNIFGHCSRFKSHEYTLVQIQNVIVFFHILAWVVLFTLPTLFHREPDQHRMNFKPCSTSGF